MIKSGLKPKTVFQMSSQHDIKKKAKKQGVGKKETAISY